MGGRYERFLFETAHLRGSQLGTRPVETDFPFPGVYINEYGSARRIEGAPIFILGVFIGIVAAMAIDRLRIRRRHA
jgi:hypothetical protein